MLSQLSATSVENAQLKRQLEGHRAGPITPSPHFPWSQPSPETEQREEQREQAWAASQQQGSQKTAPTQYFHVPQTSATAMQPQQLRAKTAAIVEGTVRPCWQPPNDNSADGAQYHGELYGEQEEESDSDEEEEETNHKRKKKKSGDFQPKLIRKEAEKIMLAAYPDVVSYRGWKTAVIHAVVHASARPDPETVLLWLNEAFLPESTVDSLHAIPKTLLSIDGKLATALQHMLVTAGQKAKNLLHRIQMKMQEELETHRRLLGGRQILHMISKAFVTSDNQEIYLGVEHLANLHLNSANDLEVLEPMGAYRESIASTDHSGKRP